MNVLNLKAGRGIPRNHLVKQAKSNMDRFILRTHSYEDIKLLRYEGTTSNIVPV